MKAGLILAASLAAATGLQANGTEVDLVAWREEIAQEVRGNILEYWLREAPDPDTGTFHAMVLNGEPQPARERGALLTSRILWAFSNAYRRDGDARYRAMADRANADLMTHFRDRQHGGFVWSIGPEGEVVNATKQVYGQAFCIYALTEYFRATGETAARDEAITLYRLLETRAFDEENGGYWELREVDWTAPRPGRRAVVEPAAKSQNTHLHVMEAYTNLLRVWPDEGLRASQRRLLGLMLDRILDKDTLHLGLHFNADWSRTSSNVSFGHDIEVAWLLTEAAEVLGDAELIARVHGLAVKLAEVALREGVDPDGGMVYEASAEGEVVRPHKDWWVQAEAVVGFLNAYQLSGEARFLAAARCSWAFITEYIVDHTQGGWRYGTTREGEPVGRPQISLWKCPYHNSRACYEAMDRIDTLLATGRESRAP